MNPLILITSLLCLGSVSLVSANGWNSWEPPVIKVIHKTVHIPKVSWFTLI